MERALEAEQEFIVNKLHKQTSGLNKDKEVLKAEREELRRQAGGGVEDKHSRDLGFRV